MSQFEPRARNGADSQFHDGGLTIPGLRIVARNDNATASGFKDLPKPDLHLIRQASEPPAPQLSEDLITRLSDNWELSFCPADELDELLDHHCNRSNPAETTVIALPSFTDPRDDIADVSNDPAAKPIGLATDTPDRAEESALATCDKRTNATPVLLFGDFFPI